MEEEREGERGARRRIRQGGSADNSSDSDTSDDEVEGEELHSGNEEGAGGADAVSDEDDEVKLLRRAPAHAPAVSKRRRLSDSDDDAEVPEACNEAHQSRKRVEPTSTRNATSLFAAARVGSCRERPRATALPAGTYRNVPGSV